MIRETNERSTFSTGERQIRRQAGRLPYNPRDSTATERRGYKGGFSEEEGDLKNLLSAKRSHL